MLLATNGIRVFLQPSKELFKIDAGLAGLAAISIAGLMITHLAVEIERHWLFSQHWNSQ